MTGASSGIGRELAGPSGAGARVALSGRSEERLDAVAPIAEGGGEAASFPAELGDSTPSPCWSRR